MKKILITGASGYIGRNLVKHFCNKADVTAIYNNKKPQFDNVKVKKIDLCQDTDTETYDAVYHCAGISSPDNNKCLNNILMAYNVSKIKTDAVYYFSTTRKIGEYAKTKRIAETILKTCSNTFNIRLDPVIGYDMTHGFMYDMLQQIQASQVSRTFTKIVIRGTPPGVYRSPIHIQNILDMIDECHEDIEVIGNTVLSSIDTMSILLNKLECLLPVAFDNIEYPDTERIIYHDHNNYIKCDTIDAIKAVAYENLHLINIKNYT